LGDFKRKDGRISCRFLNTQTVHILPKFVVIAFTGAETDEIEPKVEKCFCDVKN
jgi:hypothetical protein